jgi:hypothetical protein
MTAVKWMRERHTSSIWSCSVPVVIEWCSEGRGEGGKTCSPPFAFNMLCRVRKNENISVPILTIPTGSYAYRARTHAHIQTQTHTQGKQTHTHTTTNAQTRKTNTNTRARARTPTHTHTRARAREKNKMAHLETVLQKAEPWSAEYHSSTWTDHPHSWTGEPLHSNSRV